METQKHNCSICGKDATTYLSVPLSYYKARVTSPYSYKTITDDKARNIPICEDCKMRVNLLCSYRKRFKIYGCILFAIIAAILFCAIKWSDLGTDCLLICLILCPTVAVVTYFLCQLLWLLLHHVDQKQIKEWEKKISKDKSVAPFISNGYKIRL